MARELIYFMGIGGTGMASVAGLLKQAGYDVVGSDAGVYPPMSEVLQKSGISYKTPYDPKNLDGMTPDSIVVANVLSRGHLELEEAIRRELKLTSFPAILSEKILQDRCSVVVAGTHGKTTTTTLAAHMLKSLGYDPGYLIGGLPRNFALGYDIGSHPVFVSEGDEYDTAFFDKESKFLHYRPQFLILNNIEFDHADIFSSLEDIEKAFTKLLNLVPNSKNIVANVDDPGVERLLHRLGLDHAVTRVAGFGRAKESFAVENLFFDQKSRKWKVAIRTPRGPLELFTQLSGPHNMANLIQVVALLFRLGEQNIINMPSDQDLVKAVAAFAGVARRLDFLGEHRDILVYEDFAHHPTAMRLVIESMRKMYPERRILAVFEPKNATSRRNVFEAEFAESLSKADVAYVGASPVDLRIPENERMDTTRMCKKMTITGKAFSTNEELLDELVHATKEGDVLLFMSPGSFSGIQHKFIAAKKAAEN